MSDYLISVITVNYNNNEGLKKTLQSVKLQSFSNFEHIIIDAASTDGSVDTIREYEKETNHLIYWCSEPDKGIYNGMNKAVRVAQGEYCIFMNSGDTFYSKDVLQKVAHLLTGGDFYVGCPMLVSTHGVEKEIPPRKMSIEFLASNSPNHQSTFTRTAILKERPYNEHYKLVADWEKFFTEWLLHGRSYHPIDIVIAYYHLDGISFTRLDEVKRERDESVRSVIPDYILKGILREDDWSLLETKIKKAMLRAPVQRDLKILRNAFKFLMKDVWHELMHRFKK